MRDTVKRGDTKLAVKAGAWYVISTFMIKGMAFITTPIFARLMSNEAYGEFSNFANWMTTLLIITSAELYNTISRAFYDFTDDFAAYVSTITYASCGITIVFYALFLLFKDWMLSIVSIPEQYIHILFVVLMFQACKQSYMARERTLYRYKSVAKLTTITLLVPTVIAVAMVVCAPEEMKLSARIYGFYIPSAMIGAVCAFILLQQGKVFKKSYCKYAFKLSLPLLAHNLTAYVLTSSNTIVTNTVLGAASSAIVSIATSTIHILTILFQAVSGALTTWLMDNLEQKNYQKIRKDTVVYILMLAVVSVGVILLAPEIVLVLGGTKYLDSVTLIPGQVVAVLIQSVTSVFTIILTYDKNITKTAVYTAIVAALSVFAKVVLLPYAGVQILPFVNIVAFALLYVINYMLVRAAGYAEAVNLKMITAVLLAVCVVMGCSYILYEYNIVRYVLIALAAMITLFVAYRNRKKLIAVVKSFRKKKNKA